MSPLDFALSTRLTRHPLQRVASTGPRGAPAPKPAYRGDIDGEWTHDLHDRHSAPSTPQATMPAAASLASRITDPSAGPAARIRGNQRRAAQVAQALIRTELAPSGPRRQPPTGPRAPAAAATSGGNSFNRGLTIRGLAGPFVVMAQNFAPGTTAADIESAMTPVGGLVTSCRLLKTTPIVIAEIVFESKEGADNVIATFNNQTVSSRRLFFFFHDFLHERVIANLLLKSPGRRSRSPRLLQSRRRICPPDRAARRRTGPRTQRAARRPGSRRH